MIDIDNLAILIVDDMKSMRSIIKKTLRGLELGKVIYFAENGIEGLQVLQTNRVDLAIVDWKMPVMTGAQMLESIRNDRVLRDLPVIMVTAESEKDVVMDVAEIEVGGYLLKPLKPSILDEKIRLVVERANNPDDATVNSRKSRECQDSGKIELAIRYMEKAAKLKPGASRLVRNLGLLYAKEGKLDLAEKYLLQAASVNQHDAITRHYLCKLYWKTKNWTGVARCWGEVLSLTNKFNSEAILVGGKLLDINLSSQAIKLFSNLIDKTEKNFPLKQEILDLCMDVGEVEFSSYLVTVLMKEFPSNHSLVYKAAQIHEDMGENDKALEYYLVANQYSDSPSDVKLRIARIYLMQKKIIHADNYLSQLLRIDPENQEAINMRRSI
jgi:CheY-like chemotaxis protein